jgi:hypothetical protein
MNVWIILIIYNSQFPWTDEDSSYLEGGSTSSFQRWIPYAASLQVVDAIYYEVR